MLEDSAWFLKKGILNYEMAVGAIGKEVDGLATSFSTLSALGWEKGTSKCRSRLFLCLHYLCQVDIIKRPILGSQ